MTSNDRASSGGSPASASPSSDLRGLDKRLEAERQTLSQAASEAADTVKKEAKTLGSEARHAAEDQAEKVKEAAASNLDSFADALRAASDELSRSQPGPAAEMVSHAASGLETLTRSLHRKSTGEMVDAVRQFGRENPLGFLAGSVLAGLALGRFASVAGTASTSGGAPARREEGTAPRDDATGSGHPGGEGSR